MKRKDYVIIAVTAFMICAAIITYAFKSNSGGINIYTVAVSISEETMTEDDSSSSLDTKGRSSGKSKLTSGEALASRLAISDEKLASRLAASAAKEVAAAERAASQAALKFDVNIVTKEELMLIDGISEETAEVIIETRELIGGYAVIEEVWVIPKLTLSKCLILKPHLYIDPATARIDDEIYW